MDILHNFSIRQADVIGANPKKVETHVKPATRKQARLVSQSYEHAERVISTWSKRGLAYQSVSSKLETYRRVLEGGNEAAIRRLPVAKAVGTNIIWESQAG